MEETVNLEKILKEGKDIKGLKIAYPKPKAVKTVLTALRKARIVELDITNHFTPITNPDGDLIENLFDEQEITFRLKKTTL